MERLTQSAPEVKARRLEMEMEQANVSLAFARVSINYVIGDATQPMGDGPKIIVHVCNDIGGWGRGFFMAISKRWSEPEKCYRAWHRGEEKEPFALGEVQFVQVGGALQQGIRPSGGVPPVRYEAIREGLHRVGVEAQRLGASVHMPRIGCGLAGGKWEEVGSIVEQELADHGVPVTGYDLAS